MGEIKSVKVDNWGVFFLQKLQNFFNKTDYCDLTLQFNDNSQLKVHRLVLSACTDYFNVLEQTCEMIEDVLIMPLELQADVVVPIVNFMYTGTLEFELRMYGRLLKTARDMNMTVLLKLLEAHRRTMEKAPPTNRNQQNKPGYQRKNLVVSSRSVPNTVYSSSSGVQNRKIQQTGSNNTKSVQSKSINSYFQNSTVLQNTTIKYAPSKIVKGPSRFDYSEGESLLPPETFEQSFDTISYESKPLICKEEQDSRDYDSGSTQKDETSLQFEELRRGYSNNKRPKSVSSFESPPEKKPNIEDVKEYAEQQRMRKQIAQEYDDDNEYEETLDDEFHRDDDDEDYIPPQSFQKKQQKQQKKPDNQLHQSTIVVKHENNTPTFIVKDTPIAKTNHAKIISEVLKKYPHIVKNNKNIRLKIVPSTSGKLETQSSVIKKETLNQRPVAVPQLPTSVKRNTYPSASQRSSTTITKTTIEKQNLSEKETVQKIKTEPSTSSETSSQPRRIDSKTMHSLIAMGAENRTGPWLCLRCGVNGRPISIPSYRGFRRHLVNTHKEKIDPRLCEYCGWRSSNNRELYYHMFVEHKVKPPTSFDFPKCELCDSVLISYSELEKHITENHEENVELNQNCIYCNKIFVNENLLYSHMKLKHKEQAKEDGIMDFSDEDEMFENDSQFNSNKNKINILSDISLPKNIPIIEAEDNTPGTTITLPSDSDSIQGPKFVNEDGKEMNLTEEQRQQIISQLEAQEHGNVVMLLNDDNIIQESKKLEQSSSSKAEKDIHKPRKTKHTVKTDIDENDDGDQLIEWLDEESGNIMKVPVKSSKSENSEKVEKNRGSEDTSEETDEEIVDKSKDSKKKEKKSNKKNESDKELSTDETSLDSTKIEDLKNSEDKNDDDSGSSKKSKGKNGVNKEKKKCGKNMSDAMETLKILTGDWTDDEENSQKDTSLERDKENEKDGAVFETFTSSEADLKISKENEKLISELESDDKINKNDENENKEKMVVDSVFETDDLLKSNNKLDDVVDDDMKIIEELKNYEKEQELAAQKEKQSEKQKRKLSPTISESSSKSSGSCTDGSNYDGKPKKRGRPKKVQNNGNKSENENENKKETKLITLNKEDDDDTSENTVKKNKETSNEKKDVCNNEDTNDEDDEIKDEKEINLETGLVSEATDDENQNLLGDENSRLSDKSEGKESKKSNKSETSVEQQKLSATDDDGLISKADIRNLISDWGDEEDDDDL